MRRSLFFVFVLANLVNESCLNSNAEQNIEEIVKMSYIEKKVESVNTESVVKGHFLKELVSNGTISAKEKVRVDFKVQEKIKSLSVDEGQNVKKGQLICIIDDFKYRKSLEEAQIGYNKSLIELEDKLLGYGYNITDTAAIPRDILNTCCIQSGINNAKLTLEEAKRNLEQTRLTAPINGVVGNLQSKQNNHSSQYEYCCDVIDNSQMLVEFHVLEGELSQVSREAQIEVIPFALPEQKINGKIITINPTVEEGLIKVKGIIPNPRGILIDGMSVKVMVKKKMSDCIPIPKSAVINRQNRKVVFVHRNGIAHWVYVETGLENSTHICITDGSLKPGDEIIVSNNLNLVHESPVIILN